MFFLDFFLDYSKHAITSIADNSEWRKAASNSSMRKLKSLKLLCRALGSPFTCSYIWSYNKLVI